MDKSAETLTLVRTVCCESYKQCGRRCAICPHRPENREALRSYRQCAADFACELGSCHASGAAPVEPALAAMGD